MCRSPTDDFVIECEQGSMRANITNKFAGNGSSFVSSYPESRPLCHNSIDKPDAAKGVAGREIMTYEEDQGQVQVDSTGSGGVDEMGDLLALVESSAPECRIKSIHNEMKAFAAPAQEFRCVMCNMYV